MKVNEENQMTKKQLDSYKKKLLHLREQILNSRVLRDPEGLKIAQEDLSDEADLANNVINQAVSFRMREREIIKLTQINEALERIEDETYGHCEDCGEVISDKRLEFQPWAKLCIIHAEEREKERRIA